MSFNFSPKVVTSGLVLCVDAANQKSYISGSATWFDLTGNFNNGTLTNGPTFNSANGGSIVFDGVDDYVNIGTPSSLILTGSVTLECWVKSTVATGTVLLVGNWLVGSSLNYGLFWNDSGGLGGPGMIAGNAVAELATNTYANGTWCHLVGVGVPNGTTQFYVNSQLVKTATGTGISNSTRAWQIGAGTNQWRYTGNIGLVRIYNKALSSTEILQNYNATKTRFGL